MYSIHPGFCLEYWYEWRTFETSVQGRIPVWNTWLLACSCSYILHSYILHKIHYISLHFHCRVCFQSIHSADWGYWLMCRSWHGISPLESVHLIAMSNVYFSVESVDKEAHTMPEVYTYWHKHIPLQQYLAYNIPLESIFIEIIPSIWPKFFFLKKLSIIAANYADSIDDHKKSISKCDSFSSLGWILNM